jgi:hypothetical protein
LLVPDLVDLLASSIADATDVADIANIATEIAIEMGKSNLALNQVMPDIGAF